ncbi:MAG: Rieske (2Fe-2S) protein [Thermodesulfobacteriota bacterium]|nr:Rieske (2Fe-2S) protein [Thermodesulfobacteriota bacterium]
MEENLIDRRQAINKLTVTALSIMAGFAAFVGGGFLYPVPRQKPSALFVCLESELPEGKPLEIKDPLGRKVLLMRRGDGAITALSTVCTHLGCAVFYRPKIKQFECPCHKGFFDERGEPISGPPQRPLRNYPTEVRNGKIFIQFT